MIDVDSAAAELDLEAREYQKWSSGDAIRLVVGLVVLTLGLFLAGVAQNTIGGAEEDIVSWFNRLPDRTIGFVIGAGQFVIFFPCDGHRPKIKDGIHDSVLKAVVKIPTKLFEAAEAI